MAAAVQISPIFDPARSSGDLVAPILSASDLVSLVDCAKVLADELANAPNLGRHKRPEMTLRGAES